MHFVWLMTTVVLFVSCFDDGNVKGNNLEMQVIQILQEITDLKKRMDSLQKNLEWYISTFLNNKFVTKINSMEQGLVQEKVIRINLENKIKSMERWRVPKQVNGGWTAWGTWTSCSSTCGKGINNRVRTCTNPAPADGGNYCDGDGKEYNECQISSCKVNGRWTAWGTWTSCSSTCGKGINNRVRTCTNPAPADGGNYCDGDGKEYNECQISSCKVNGEWTIWTSWNQCLSSTGCGSGIQGMTRACTNPRPAHGGEYCDGDVIRYRECSDTRACNAATARLVLGRLEVRVNGTWGTVCDDSFETSDATVACRMLGLGGNGSVIEASSVQDGVDSIWLDEVSCLGNETSLFECGYYGQTIGRHDCSHSEDVGVRCS